MGQRNGKPFFRAEVVGSLLRPQKLIDAREQFRLGKIDQTALWAMENDAIAQAVKLQEELGFEAVTDGEFRRNIWWYDFINAIEGIRISEPTKKSGFSGVGAGEWEYFPMTVQATGKIGHSKNILLPEYQETAKHTTKMVKVTMPSPSRIHFHGGRAAVDRQAYPDMDQFWADIVSLYRQEIASLEGAGCRYIQIDDPMLTYFIEDRLRAEVRELGEDPDQLLNKYVSVLNDCIAQRRADTNIGIHLCRGNSRSTWMVQGSYESIAEAVFSSLDVDTYFLEYDDERSGGFEPLRFLPKGKVAVLGLITTKRADLESMDMLKHRVDAARKIVADEDLAISPQCGFASNVEGNIITYDDQLKKLELVIATAKDLWGSV